jgi:hypothetical protein
MTKTPAPIRTRRAALAANRDATIERRFRAQPPTA